MSVPRPDIPHYNPEFVRAVLAMEVRDVLVWTEDPSRFASLLDKLRHLRKKQLGMYWRGFVHKKFLYIVRVE